MRGLSLLAGAATVYLAYRVACRIMPDSPTLAAAAGQFVASLPQFLFVTTAISNDALSYALALWALDGALTLPAVPALPPPRRHLTFLKWGVVVGLAALAKTNGLLALGPLMLAAWQGHAPRRDWRGLARATLLLGAGLLLVDGWWFARNLTLYGDLTGINAMTRIVTRPEPFPGSLTTLLGELRGLWWSFWGLFGWFNLPMPRPIYALLSALSLAGFAGWLRWLWARRLRLSFGWQLALASLALTLAAWWGWNTLVPGNQGRLLYTALPAIALILIAGWARLARLLLLAGNPPLAPHRAGLPPAPAGGAGSPARRNAAL
jgi:hypothetical protein